MKFHLWVPLNWFKVAICITSQSGRKCNTVGYNIQSTAYLKYSFKFGCKFRIIMFLPTAIYLQDRVGVAIVRVTDDGQQTDVLLY